MFKIGDYVRLKIWFDNASEGAIGKVINVYDYNRVILILWISKEGKDSQTKIKKYTAERILEDLDGFKAIIAQTLDETVMQKKKINKEHKQK